MGDLIVLPSTDRSSRSARYLDVTAEILFFTGVRYYRMADETPIVESKPRRRRRSSPTAKINVEAQRDCLA